MRSIHAQNVHRLERAMRSRREAVVLCHGHKGMRYEWASNSGHAVLDNQTGREHTSLLKETNKELSVGLNSDGRTQ